MARRPTDRADKHEPQEIWRHRLSQMGVGWLVIGAVVVIYFLTGIYTVGPTEAGLVKRFGRYVATAEPGIHYHLPAPIESAVIVSVLKVRKEEIEQAVFARMRSERERIAAQLRAEGEQRAKEIRSAANRDREITLTEARRQAEETMGQGDAEALATYANAYNQDLEFYRFWRSLESYKESFAANSMIVLSTDSDYLRFLESMELVKPEK